MQKIMCYDYRQDYQGGGIDNVNYNKYWIKDLLAILAQYFIIKIVF